MVMTRWAKEFNSIRMFQVNRVESFISRLTVSSFLGFDGLFLNWGYPKRKSNKQTNKFGINTNYSKSSDTIANSRFLLSIFVVNEHNILLFTHSDKFIKYKTSAIFSFFLHDSLFFSDNKARKRWKIKTFVDKQHDTNKFYSRKIKRACNKAAAPAKISFSWWEIFDLRQNDKYSIEATSIAHLWHTQFSL